MRVAAIFIVTAFVALLITGFPQSFLEAVAYLCISINLMLVTVIGYNIALQHDRYKRMQFTYYR